jgi:hypothetical protein
MAGQFSVMAGQLSVMAGQLSVMAGQLSVMAGQLAATSASGAVMGPALAAAASVKSDTPQMTERPTVVVASKRRKRVLAIPLPANILANAAIKFRLKPFALK